MPAAIRSSVELARPVLAEHRQLARVAAQIGPVEDRPPAEPLADSRQLQHHRRSSPARRRAPFVAHVQISQVTPAGRGHPTGAHAFNQACSTSAATTIDNNSTTSRPGPARALPSAQRAA